jgi:uncharacterized protein YjbI with pentapeptide repeats
LDPVLPLSPGRAERHGFEYYRHGTLSLYAALNTASGKSSAAPRLITPARSSWPFWNSCLPAGLIGAKLLGASFYDCTLDRTDFSLANCQRAAFTIVTTGKQMKFFNADCTNAQFKHGDFKGLDFTSAILDRSLFDDP